MLNYFQNPDTVMSGWGLSKASISAGSSRLRKGRQLPGQPGHGGKKRRAPENKVEVYFGVLRWPPGSKKKKKSNFTHLATKCRPHKWFFCWQDGLSVSLIAGVWMC